MDLGNTVGLTHLALRLVPKILDIRLRGCGVTARMVVHYDQRRGAGFQCAVDNLAWVDRGMIDGVALVNFVRH